MRDNMMPRWIQDIKEAFAPPPDTVILDRAKFMLGFVASGESSPGQYLNRICDENGWTWDFVLLEETYEVVIKRTNYEQRRDDRTVERWVSGR